MQRNVWNDCQLKLLQPNSLQVRVPWIRLYSSTLLKKMIFQNIIMSLRLFIRQNYIPMCIFVACFLQMSFKLKMSFIDSILNKFSVNFAIDQMTWVRQGMNSVYRKLLRMQKKKKKIKKERKKKIKKERKK